MDVHHNLPVFEVQRLKLNAAPERHLLRVAAALERFERLTVFLGLTRKTDGSCSCDQIHLLRICVINLNTLRLFDRFSRLIGRCRSSACFCLRSNGRRNYLASAIFRISFSSAYNRIVALICTRSRRGCRLLSAAGNYHQKNS
ncbi:hypothetical protein D3C81_1517110 [compost metagenome]